MSYLHHLLHQYFLQIYPLFEELYIPTTKPLPFFTFIMNILLLIHWDFHNILRATQYDKVHRDMAK